MNSRTSGLTRFPEDDDLSDFENSSLFNDLDETDQRAAQENRGWNMFREIPVMMESRSMESTAWVDTCLQILKLLAFILVFGAVLGSAVVAKGTLLFITSQLRKERQIPHCNRRLALKDQFIIIHNLDERISWLWAAFIIFSFPELGIFLRSCRMYFFKVEKKPTDPIIYVATFLVETLQTIGVAILVLFILPELDVVKGAILMNAMCFVPSVLNALTRDRNSPRYYLRLIFDILAISAQASAFVVWPLLDGKSILYLICVASVFISVGWWENFIGPMEKQTQGYLIWLATLRDALKLSRYYTSRFTSVWKILVFMTCILTSLAYQGDDPFSFFTLVYDAFGERYYTAHEVQVVIQDAYDGLLEYIVTGNTLDIPASWASSLWVSLIQLVSAYICFSSGKLACKILIQNFSFTFALTLVGPVTINILIILCGMRNADACVFHNTIPDYLFFDVPPVYLLRDHVGREMAWVWILWLMSQAWICFHTWRPQCERLASTEKLFAKPWYCGPLIDQCLLMNRRQDDVTIIHLEDIEDVDNNMSINSADKSQDIKPSDYITRIYTCTTMWHETKDEMMEFLKSMFRLDEDQSARRVAQKYWGIVDPDYYELEAHIFMDDAFEVSDHNIEDSQVNYFVKCLVDTVDEAASEVHLTNIRLRPPKKYPTPYGGRLEWVMPGKNKLICHLKDKSKIRHRKRWSQVMYMYYFLGHRLMDLPISVDRKEVIAENTYLLALDGDIDFKPSAVTLLIDLMKKNKKLGAACGRIHPVGSGFMAWYQKFEYAIGHWLQKATEHMIGCVLCSPGCCSLFRGKALMDDNVMRKYALTPSEARHYVQYDQGEDRWLCTLLLQRGYRVEYSAAADSFTHCPESFFEFFNQRRRWVPSTMANIFDLLSDSKHTIEVNDNISKLYIFYQSLLMAGTVLGPGTIFMMLVGAMNAIIGISNMNALLINLVPIAIFIVVCMTCKSERQLFLASLITCAYAMIMMMVIIGFVLQILEDGWLAPSSIFTILVFGSFFVTAALHPQEITCLLYLTIYYITIPSMYMLLIIYSLCNLNNVSWGTREVVQNMSEKEQKEAEEAKKEMETQSATEGPREFGVAGLFRCTCCTNPKDHKDGLHLVQIAHSIEKIEKKLEAMGAMQDTVEIPNQRRSSMLPRGNTSSMLPEYEDSEISMEEPMEVRDPLINPLWMEDPNLQKGEVDFLSTAETEFWKDLIDSYLQPIDENKQEQERINADLKELRDKMVFAFVLLNALFVLVVLLLQLNQEQVHIKWPLGQKYSLVYDEEVNIINIYVDYLMLEPIGSVFLLFFGSVMLIQFIAMLFHRMNTLCHLLATVKIDWYFSRKTDQVTQQTQIETNAIVMARELQKLNMDDINITGVDEPHVSLRKTLHNLECARESKHNIINLDSNFKRRLQNPEPDILKRLSSLSGNLDARRATLRALQMRRKSLVEKRRSQMMMQPHRVSAPEDLYAPDPLSLDATRRRPTGAILNRSNEPAPDSDNDGNPVPPRKSTRFML